MTIKLTAGFITAMSLAFALGWFAQGYRIYSDMWVNEINMLPQLGLKK